MAKIAIVGAGWNGCHIALELASRGHQVSLLEKDPEIFAGVSGKFGIRVHKGPHYPRSPRTRDSCRAAFDQFCSRYAGLVVPLQWSIYALGKTDSSNEPPKVSRNTFDSVCRESNSCIEVSSVEFGFQELEAAYDLNEPCAVTRSCLQDYFKNELAQAKVRVHLDIEVVDLAPFKTGVRICFPSGQKHVFDRVVNTTAYTSLLPKNISQCSPGPMAVVYQVCVALEYLDLQPGSQAISFIVMDGWFPSLMPALVQQTPEDRYVVTHAYHTNLRTYEHPNDASNFLSSITDQYMAQMVKPLVEKEITRFWPIFTKRFQYIGWKGAVIAKLRTEKEFRSSVVFEKDKIIYVFPGKISNVIEAGEEVATLISDNIRCHPESSVRILKNGSLDRSRDEIMESPLNEYRNTGFLQAYKGHLPTKNRL